MLGRKILVDVGSSTVKVYKLENGKLESVLSKSFGFKQNYRPDRGLHFNDEEALVRFLERVNANFLSGEIDAYATGIFRELTDGQLQDLRGQLRKRARTNLIILSHEKENEALERALLGRANTDEPILILNIGGATTEMILAKDKKPTGRHNLNLGVGTINSQYDTNGKLDPVLVEKIKRDILANLPDINCEIKTAIFSGGELTFMKRTGYDLISNDLFSDLLHPSMIWRNEFKEGNETVFYRQEISDIEALYPENPGWVQGSRACEIIAEAIFDKYNIDRIIPSDVNLIDGLVLEENT